MLRGTGRAWRTPAVLVWVGDGELARRDGRPTSRELGIDATGCRCWATATTWPSSSRPSTSSPCQPLRGPAVRHRRGPAVWHPRGRHRGQRGAGRRHPRGHRSARAAREARTCSRPRWTMPWTIRDEAAAWAVRARPAGHRYDARPGGDPVDEVYSPEPTGHRRADSSAPSWGGRHDALPAALAVLVPTGTAVVWPSDGTRLTRVRAMPSGTHRGPRRSPASAGAARLRRRQAVASRCASTPSTWSLPDLAERHLRRQRRPRRA